MFSRDELCAKLLIMALISTNIWVESFISIRTNFLVHSDPVSIKN